MENVVLIVTRKINMRFQLILVSNESLKSTEFPIMLIHIQTLGHVCQVSTFI